MFWPITLQYTMITIVVLSKSDLLCFVLVFFSISWIDFIFFVYFIQNLLKYGSLKINPELRQSCADTLQNNYL